MSKDLDINSTELEGDGWIELSLTDSEDECAFCCEPLLRGYGRVPPIFKPPRINHIARFGKRITHAEFSCSMKVIFYTKTMP